jgi:hypothetical protein
VHPHPQRETTYNKNGKKRRRTWYILGPTKNACQKEEEKIEKPPNIRVAKRKKKSPRISA